MANPQKDAAIAELAEKFRSSSAAVITEYRGLTVAQLGELRSKLRGNATYSVVKNTLTERAAKEAGAKSARKTIMGWPQDRVTRRTLRHTPRLPRRVRLRRGGSLGTRATSRGSRWSFCRAS